MTFRAGNLIGGRYRLEELIGSGGMGDVFRARDIVLERSVAVKLVESVDMRRREEMTKSFLREARISAAIAHRNVVQILDFGTHEGVVPFMVMELLEGESLASMLVRGESLSFEWILMTMSEILDGLAVAHDQGVVHRDIKPENIYLAESAAGVHPKLLDFGISKMLDPSGTAPVTTTAGQVVGTPAYMSPEQARGVKAIDKRTDVYSVGVVLYEMLSGEMPFYSENPGDLLLMIMTQQATPLVEIVPEVGEELSALVARAMSKDPAERFEDARELARELVKAADRLLGTEASRRIGLRERPASWRKQAALSRSSRTPRAPGPPGPPSPPPLRMAGTLHGSHNPRLRSRKRVIAAVAGAAFLAGGIGGAAAWLGRSSTAQPTRLIVVRADPAAPSAAEEPLPAAVHVLDTTVPSAAQAPKAATPTRAARARDTATVLAESFRRQRADVVICVNAHAEEAERTPKLAVRFAIAPDGSVVSAQVLPSGIAGTAMGSCIATAARAMRFPKQTDPITFEVPLTTKKGG